MKPIRTFSLISLVFLISACANDWFERPPEALRDQAGWQELNFCNLEEDDQARYLRKLSATTFVEVSKKDAQHLCAKAIVSDDFNGKALIVRAVYIGK